MAQSVAWLYQISNTEFKKEFYHFTYHHLCKTIYFTRLSCRRHFSKKKIWICQKIARWNLLHIKIFFWLIKFLMHLSKGGGTQNLMISPHYSFFLPPHCNAAGFEKSDFCLIRAPLRIFVESFCTLKKIIQPLNKNQINTKIYVRKTFCIPISSWKQCDPSVHRVFTSVLIAITRRK